MEPARFFVTFLIFPPKKSFPQRQRALLFTLQLLPELLNLGLQLLLFIFECFCCLWKLQICALCAFFGISELLCFRFVIGFQKRNASVFGDKFCILPLKLYYSAATRAARAGAFTAGNSWRYSCTTRAGSAQRSGLCCKIPRTKQKQRTQASPRTVTMNFEILEFKFEQIIRVVRSLVIEKAAWNLCL